MMATTITFDPLWAFVLGDYDEHCDDEATTKPKDESREPEQQGREEQEQATVTSRATIPKAVKSRLEKKRDTMEKKSKLKLGRSMHSKAPGSKASESKGSVARSKVIEAMSSQSKFPQKSKASQAKASKRKPMETTIFDSKSSVSEEQESEAKRTTQKPDSPVTKDLQLPTKSVTKVSKGVRIIAVVERRNDTVEIFVS
jgi:hypothetical protein